MGQDLSIGDADVVEQPRPLDSGSPAKGQYHCSSCGYGVTVHTTLPRCPMCGSGSWEQVPWSPLTRSLQGDAGGRR